MENVLKISKVCVSPIVLFILALIILLVYVFKAGTNYLNIGKIFKDYISIFSNAKKHLWIFWGVPVLLSGALVQVTVLTSGLAENLCVFLSILVSAFFAMLSILVSKDATKQASKLYEQVLKETASTVLLEIVLCMVSLVISLSIIFLDTSMTQWVQVIISLFEYYLLFAMLLNMLILIKRFKSLIDNG
jgi:membrane protein